jgi:2,4-dienoyl-CoA reductase-like NADH-dependent reductase (Old Yellow Enzyme family)
VTGQPLSDRFRFKAADDLRRTAERLGIALPFSDDLSPLLEPITVAGRGLPNRIAAQPMEGCDGDADGAPGELTWRRYQRIAEGGSGLIWVEATAAFGDGRANARQLWISNRTVGHFTRLAGAIRAAACATFGPDFQPYLVLQLTHSGRFSRTAAPGLRKAACHNPHLDRDRLPVWTDGELDHIRDGFVEGARLAAQAGFDAVDIKSCHGYLMHELLGARLRTDSRYGGPYQNRARLLLDTASAIRSQVPGLALAVRMTATDSVPAPYGVGVAEGAGGGTDLTEPITLARDLAARGCSLLNVSAGIPTYDPQVGRPFDRPVAGTAPSPEHPLVGVMRLLGLGVTIQQAAPSVPVVGTGFSWLRQFWPHVAASLVGTGQMAFAGLGRGIFAYPDAPADLMAAGRLDPRKCCIACSRCTELMRLDSTPGCVVRDYPLYPDIHRQATAEAARRHDAGAA